VKSREAVRALQRHGLPQRDIGRLMHLSHQRVAQLLDESASGPRDDGAAGARSVKAVRATSPTGARPA
jgi:hypothetical protein